MPDPTDIRCRPARAGDALAIAALAAELGYASSSGEMLSRLATLAGRTDHAVFVAESGGTVSGWIHASVEFHLESGEFGEVAGLVVAAGVRGKGIGSLLLAEAESWARAQGLGLLRIRSNIVRSEAHGFYRNRGYSLRKTQAVFDKPLR
jgi:GNAT superfamily N-acetyltransferase